MCIFQGPSPDGFTSVCKGQAGGVGVIEWFRQWSPQHFCTALFGTNRRRGVLDLAPKGANGRFVDNSTALFGTNKVYRLCTTTSSVVYRTCWNSVDNVTALFGTNQLLFLMLYSGFSVYRTCWNNCGKLPFSTHYLEQPPALFGTEVPHYLEQPCFRKVLRIIHLMPVVDDVQVIGTSSLSQVV